jgi:hypothetical protein
MLEGFENQPRRGAEENDPASPERCRNSPGPPHWRDATLAIALDNVIDVVDLKHRMRETAIHRLRERVLIDHARKKKQPLLAEERQPKGFVALCTADKTDPLGTAALNLCHGYVRGAIDLQKTYAAAERRPVVFSCLPTPRPSFNEGQKRVAQWAASDPLHHLHPLTGAVRMRPVESDGGGRTA